MAHILRTDWLLVELAGIFFTAGCALVSLAIGMALIMTALGISALTLSVDQLAGHSTLVPQEVAIRWSR